MSHSLTEVSDFMDDLLDIDNVQDWTNALNGLQLASGGTVASIAAAVDASEASIRSAVSAGADLLIVHHGLFWPGLQPITGAHYRKISHAIRANLAIYSAHLPLDLHATLGNNALLARSLGLDALEPFFFEKGRFIGVKAGTDRKRADVIAALEAAVAGPVKAFPGGPECIASIGIVTGGAGAGIQRAADEGVDTFITGEGPHWSAIAAQELGINFLLAGHYATETFGVKALASLLSEKFEIPWQFIDHPTGL